MRFYGTGKTELKTTEHNCACDCVFVCGVFSFFQIDTNQSDLGLIAVETGEFDIFFLEIKTIMTFSDYFSLRLSKHLIMFHGEESSNLFFFIN